LAQGPVELELINVSEEVAHIRDIPRHVILCARVEILIATLHRRRHALIFQAQVPPGFVIGAGLDLSGEHLPPPFVDGQAEGQKRNFIERLPEQYGDVRVRGRNGFKQSDFLQILGRDGQCYRVANGFVEPVVGAILEQERLVLVSALIKIVPKLVMDGDEIHP